MRGFSVLLTSKGAELIRQGPSWGSLRLKVAYAEQVGMVSVVGHKDDVRLPVETDVTGHFLKSCDDVEMGLWYRVEPALHQAWMVAIAKTGAVPLDVFRDAVASGFRDPGEKMYFAITHIPEASQWSPEFALWRVSRKGVEPSFVDVEPEFVDARALAPHWPVADVESARVMVVGCGSIGGAAVRELAAAGVGRLDLVDPGPLRWRNLARHVCGPRHVGRAKVTALKEDLTQIRPRTEVRAHDLDVVRDADQVRELLQDTDVVLCATDGISPRRVTGHLARRAGVTAVLACVLENGEFGEIVRLRPWQHHGCLQCRRQQLFDEGGMLPESLLDAEYGLGTSHRPMTAVASDLHLIGGMAAKVTLATLLHDKGHHDQRMDAEHALVALRPRPGWAPPFDVGRAGEVRWMPATPPREGCPTCEPA